MNKLVKYLAFIFLFNNIIYSLKGFLGIAENVFYVFMLISLTLSLFSVKIIKEIILDKSFYLFFIINILNIIYYVFIEFGDLGSFKYLSARFVQFSVFSISIFILKDHFTKTLIQFLKFVTIGSLLTSLAFNFPDFSSRYMGIFFNPNEFSIIMVFGFAIILFTQNKSILNYTFLILFVFAIILSGSRAAIIGVFIALFMYFNHLKSKNLLNVIFVISLITLFSFLGGENNAIQRIFADDILTNRKYEYLYAIDTFLQKPIFGHGLKNYAYIDFSLIQFDDVQIDYGAHNGYLSILVQYGALFSSIFFGLLFYNINKIFTSNINIFGENSLETRFLFFILVYTLVNGLFENTLIGINFFQSNLFWITFGYLLFVKYNKKSESNSLSN